MRQTKRFHPGFLETMIKKPTHKKGFSAILANSSHLIISTSSARHRFPPGKTLRVP
jgi:hypothetical protein